ncbi:MAG: hypothetical protein DI630_21070 [Gordonia sp. (in: high G+C Gram-positive bacteria)]|nr:MAG: hypothetical protein DI630_21070 [Gordonia sp. (in: high G+C Gram-positive bacteria)]
MSDSTGRKRSKTRAELEKVFGDDLPLTSSDERPIGRSDEGHSNADMRGDEWFIRNRPPHHG